jgi:hypothetical protein
VDVCGEGNIKYIMLIRQTARRTGPKDVVWWQARQETCRVNPPNKTAGKQEAMSDNMHIIRRRLGLFILRVKRSGVRKIKRCLSPHGASPLTYTVHAWPPFCLTPFK